MSNVIKSGFVRFDEHEKKVINEFQELNKNVKAVITEQEPSDEPAPVITRDLASVLKERENKLIEEEANLKVKYQQLMQVADSKADEILSDARKIAMDMKNEAISMGHKEGYEKGLADAASEIEAIKASVIEERNSLEEEFNKKIDLFEKEFIDIFINLCEKLFGIIIDDKQDVLLHVINRTITDLEKSNNYIIRVSRDDYELVNNKKQLLYDYVADGASIEIVESDNLTHNKCLIETDNSVIDCSVDTQIKNLMADLEILSKL